MSDWIVFYSAFATAMIINAAILTALIWSVL